MLIKYISGIDTIISAVASATVIKRVNLLLVTIFILGKVDWHMN